MRSHGCCPVRVTGVSLSCGLYLPAPLTGNKEESKELLALLSTIHILRRIEPSVWYYCCCFGIAPRAQLLKKSAWLLHLIGDKVPPTACDRSEVKLMLLSSHQKLWLSIRALTVGRYSVCVAGGALPC